jgi:hypothetical protein
MRVLVATTETQGQQPGDYAWAVDGELVTAVVSECCSPDTCGCARGFSGLASSFATTTAVIVDRPEIDDDTLWEVIADSLERDGWAEHLSVDEFDELVDEHLTVIDLICASFPVGTVVNRWGTKVYARMSADAA